MTATHLDGSASRDAASLAPSAPMLPSPILRDHYARQVADKVAGIKPSLRELLLDGLGDLALALARRPIRRWHGGRDALARALGERWVWPEATALIELGAQTGLLVPIARPDAEGQLRPVDVGVFNWLGARRIARTRDQDELMDRRFNGGLFDMFAMAPSFVEPEASMGLVSIMIESEGPFEELLELGSALAAAAVAWGCEASPEQRVYLTSRAMPWTQPMGADWNRETGTALLVLECQRHEEREHLVNLASETISEIVGSAFGDADLAQNPAIIATFETCVAMLLAGLGPSIGAAPGHVPTPRAPSRERVERVVASLPRQHAHRVGRALARIMPPGPERNALLVAAARRALELGDPQGLEPLEAIVSPRDEAGALVAEVLARLAEAPRDARLIETTLAACEAVRAWEACPAETLARFADLAADDAVPPDVRIECAGALGRHGVRATTPGPFADALVAIFERDLEAGSPELIAGSVGTLLHLGSPDPRLGRLAFGLCTAELPPRLRQLVAHALNEGIALVPDQIDALVGAFVELSERPDAATAMLYLSGLITDTQQTDFDLGPFSPLSPLPSDKRELLLRALAPLAGQGDDPQLAAEAATACAALMRGDQEFAHALVKLRGFASDPKIKSLYDLAIGACRVFDPEVVERLARDAAKADHDVAAAACVALRLLVETFEQAGHLDPWIEPIRLRIEEPGPHQVPMQQLLVQLATLPLGDEG
ncbi:MAG: hypothetical protein IT385_20550 [Deltaproteobacteria bacterium]|nr:hypothetical protein [Deltaproteobacteria bacterium]